MPRAYARHTHDTWRGVWSMLLFGTLGVLTVFGAAPQPLRDEEAVRTSRIASVPLTDDDGGQSLFDVTTLAPGRSVTRCIGVRYDGNPDPSEVRLRAEGVTSATALADYVRVAVEGGTGGGAAGCAGFTGAAVFPGSRTLVELAAAAGAGTGWTPVPHEARTFRITVSLDAAVPGALQGKRFGADLVWGVTPGAAAPPTVAPTAATPTTAPPAPAPTVPPAPATVPPAPAAPAEPPAPPVPATPAPVSPSPSTSVGQTSPPQPNANPVPRLPEATPSPTAAAPSPSAEAGTGDGGAGGAGPRSAAGGDGDEAASPRAAVRRAIKGLGAAAGKVVEGARQFGQAAGAAAGRAAHQPQAYASVGVLCLFLLAQNLLDRRDPKLALAPVLREPYLTFADLPEAADRSVEWPQAAGRSGERPQAAASTPGPPRAAAPHPNGDVQGGG
ncbi:MAG TPA: hypothetical protein VFY17_04720 [Pilimelia sp.]|nr:hypothetical protein [Pilimelia sp.]